MWYAISFWQKKNARNLPFIGSCDFAPSMYVIVPNWSVYLKELCLWEFGDDFQLTELHFEQNKSRNTLIWAGHFDVGQS